MTNENIKSFMERDPAAKCSLEIKMLYPGYKAIRYHNIAHKFYNRSHYVIARMISERARKKTGIEIHPGATIGKNFFIDHGGGVVIGETTIIGDNVMLYQGVTLGGTSGEKKKRHPTIEDNVIIGAGAKILGNITIGKNSRIGANSVVTKNVPPNSVVVGVPGRVAEDIRSERKKIESALEHGRLPDPVANAITGMLRKIDSMENIINVLCDKVGISEKTKGQIYNLNEEDIYQEFSGEGEGI